MEAYALDSVASLTHLVSIAHGSDEPVLIVDGADESLVAMSPTVFERILFDSALLNWEGRDSLRLG